MTAADWLEFAAQADVAKFKFWADYFDSGAAWKCLMNKGQNGPFETLNACLASAHRNEYLGVRILSFYQLEFNRLKVLRRLRG